MSQTLINLTPDPIKIFRLAMKDDYVTFPPSGSVIKCVPAYHGTIDGVLYVSHSTHKTIEIDDSSDLGAAKEMYTGKHILVTPDVAPILVAQGWVNVYSVSTDPEDRVEDDGELYPDILYCWDKPIAYDSTEPIEVCNDVFHPSPVDKINCDYL